MGMIPLVGKQAELAFMKEQAVKTAEAVIKKAGAKLDYQIGTMIEVPRAAITADEIATEAQFFSFGTNDLTQMGCGFSRDDSAPFLKKYVEQGIYDRDPFQSLDQGGVGEFASRSRRDALSTRCSSAASVASTVAIRPASTSSTALASTTSRALRTASRSRSSRPLALLSRRSVPSPRSVPSWPPSCEVTTHE